MDSQKNFDFGALLRNHSKSHKARPAQFVSVAGGVQKRLENKIKCRRSSRFNIFDSTRDLPQPHVPKQSEHQAKIQHRRQQLEKWQEERNKKRKEAAAQKKKPFVTGLAHQPLNYVPPPPPPKAIPRTGRVTRSQTANNKTKNTAPAIVKDAVKQTKTTKSFAPKNATFKPPEIKSMAKVPTFDHQPKIRKNKAALTFDPVMPNIPKKTVIAKAQPRKTHSKLSKEKQLIATTNTNTTKNGTNTKKSKKKSTPKLIASSSSSEQQSSSEQCSSEDMMSPVIEKTHKKTNTPKTSVPVTPKNHIPKSESSSEEKLRPPKNLVDDFSTPKQTAEYSKISPCVTLSRGKDNARREMKKKMEEGLLDDDFCDIDSVDHFKQQLNSEIKRLEEFCDTWEKISQQINLPDAVQEGVLGATGQARLLMSSKLQQFASLVARCEHPEPGHALVTPTDLHGFWDMVFMQIENVNMRFKKLEEMRARNWADEVPAVPKKKTAPLASKQKTAVKPVGTSRLREMIAAARKAKMQDIPTAKAPEEEEALACPVEDKTFEGGFFCVRSPVRLSAPGSPATPATPGRNTSLLKAVLSSEAKNSTAKRSTSMAMFRASLIGKHVDDGSPLAEPLVQLTPINLNATPGRSILKPKNKQSLSAKKKSIKLVLFHDSGTSSASQSESEHNDNVSGVHMLKDANIEEPKQSDVKTVDKMSSQVNINNKSEDKENWDTKKKSMVIKDVAEDRSPVMTRSRRRSMATPANDVLVNSEQTPRRSSRRLTFNKK